MKKMYVIHLVAQAVLLASVWFMGTALWALILNSVGALWIAYIMTYGQDKQTPQPLVKFLKEDFKFVMIPVFVFVLVTVLLPSTRQAPFDFRFRLALNARLHKSIPIYHLESLEARPEVQRAFEAMREADVCELKVGLKKSAKDSYPSRLLTCQTIPELGSLYSSIDGGSDIVLKSGGRAPFLIFKFNGRYVLTGEGKNGNFTAEQVVESVAAAAASMRPTIEEKIANEQRWNVQRREDDQKARERKEKAAKSFE